MPFQLVSPASGEIYVSVRASSSEFFLYAINHKKLERHELR